MRIFTSRILLLWCIWCFPIIPATAQTSYTDSIHTHRTKYKQEFLTDAHSPLTVEDTAFLRFYPPQKKYRIVAQLQLSMDTLPFQMQTHSGKIKMYRTYGVLHFRLNKKQCTLEVYQSMDLLKKESLKDYLFIPFNDLTNYQETYGGGRYLDVSINDIVNNTIVLDFNKCYNPYCAYAADGYSCPIPPIANRMNIKVTAGEKLFGKQVKE